MKMLKPDTQGAKLPDIDRQTNALWESSALFLKKRDFRPKRFSKTVIFSISQCKGGFSYG